MRPVFTLILAGACAVAGQEPPDDFTKASQEIAANPRNSLAHYNLGRIFLRQRNYQSAGNEFREALQGDLQPPSVESDAHRSLANIFELTGQRERALNELRLAERTGDALNLAIAVNDLPVPPGSFRIGDGVTVPELVSQITPQYSAEARVAGLEGTVVIAAVIGSDGIPRDPKVVTSLGLGLDEAALQAVVNWRYRPGERNGAPVAVFTAIAVDFNLPERLSHWHLIRAEFQIPENASRPAFLETHYPLGAGVRAEVVDHARLIGVIGREGTASLSFQIDEQGIPNHFVVRTASDGLWVNEAIAVLQDWRFSPGVLENKAIAVPCTFDLVWGPRSLTPANLRWAQTQLRSALNPPGQTQRE